MRSRALWAFFAIALIAAAAAALWFTRPWESLRPPIPEAPAPSPIAPPVAQGPRYPPPAPAPVDKPLPRLDESDATLLEALSTLMGPQALAKLVQPERLVRHIVVTIDNLPRQIFAPQFSPVNPPGGQLRTTGQGETLAIAPANAARYTPYVRALEAMDGERLVALYARFHPLFQQAYVELGYPNAFFNDRLVEVIDHLLATPEVKGPVQLVVPHVLAEFADPSLQERSTGQKLLLRMGPENAARVKAKLRELRGALVRQP
ncbi:MAG TPA: DUF3014 domain-containing protein [Usitatibacter sp.]|nr:DUF3014 domain-containing protein [Usitatibacter sp.]